LKELRKQLLATRIKKKKDVYALAETEGYRQVAKKIEAGKHAILKGISLFQKKTSGEATPPQG